MTCTRTFPPAPRAPEAPTATVVINTYPPGQVARLLLLVLGFGLGAYVLWRIQEVLFLLLIAVLLATAIEPIVNRLRRGPFTRGSGVLVVYTASPGSKSYEKLQLLSVIGDQRI